MQWLPYAAGAAVALAIADFSIKVAAGKIGSDVGALLYSVTTFMICAAWVLHSVWRGHPLRYTGVGLFPAMMSGVAFALVTIFLYKTFATGVPISIAIPVIRIGGILLASALGVMLLHEQITWRYAVGVLLSLGGIYLIATR